MNWLVSTIERNACAGVALSATENRGVSSPSCSTQWCSSSVNLPPRRCVRSRRKRHRAPRQLRCRSRRWPRAGDGGAAAGALGGELGEVDEDALVDLERLELLLRDAKRVEEEGVRLVCQLRNSTRASEGQHLLRSRSARRCRKARHLGREACLEDHELAAGRGLTVRLDRHRDQNGCGPLFTTVFPHAHRNLQALRRNLRHRCRLVSEATRCAGIAKSGTLC